MNLKEYEQLPEGEPNDPVEIGALFRPKSERIFKPGDHIYFYEVIGISNPTSYQKSYESILRYSILE